MFKFTGKNGGDPGEYWRAITLAARVTAADAVKGARFLLRRILDNTSKGIDYQGKPFEAYSEDYALRTGKSVVDMQQSGSMLGALRISVNGRVLSRQARGSAKEEALSMGVGIYDNDKNAMKAHVHNEGLLRRHGRPTGRLGFRGGVMRIPKRRWLDATNQTQKAVEKVIGDSIDDRVRKVL